MFKYLHLFDFLSCLKISSKNFLRIFRRELFLHKQVICYNSPQLDAIELNANDKLAMIFVSQHKAEHNK